MSAHLRFIENSVKSGQIDVNVKMMLISEKWPGCTALHLAVENQDLDIVHFLLELGADPNIPDSNGLTSLHYACRLSEFKIKCLTRENVQCNAEVMQNFMKAQEEIVRLLIQHNANVNAKDRMDRTPLLHVNNILSDTALLRCIGANNAINVSEILDSRLGIMKVLTRSGADINATDYEGVTTVHCFIYNCKERGKAVKQLIEMGLDLKLRTKTGKSLMSIFSQVCGNNKIANRSLNRTSAKDFPTPLLRSEATFSEKLNLSAAI